MEIYLPIAEMSVSLWLILGLGGMVGLLSGLFGVGGGFLLTPLLMMIGIPPAVAAASDANQIVGSSASGAFAHKKLGNVDVRLGAVMVVGGILGSTLGVQVVKMLQTIGNFEFVVKALYVVLLGGIGSFMFIESLNVIRGKTEKEENDGDKDEAKKPSVFKAWAEKLPFIMEFPASGIRFSLLVPLGLGIFVGLLAAILGVGGGFIMLPAMIYILGMPTMMAVGTGLIQILFTSASATIQLAYFNHTVDFILAMLLLLGSSVGAQLGARAGKKLKAEQLRILLSLIVLAVMVKMLVDLTVTPSSLIVLAGGGH